MSVPVRLYPADVALATAAGTRRFAVREGVAEHRWNRVDAMTEALEIEAIGAEIAVARALGKEWADTDMPDYHGDVGDGVQVRHTRHFNGRLLLHDSDRDEHFFFLVTGYFPVFDVVGYLRGDRAKALAVTRELQPGRPVMAVDQKHLQPLKAESVYNRKAAA